jgi:hypothetical protein
MSGEAVIREVVLRVPGVRPAEARRLADDVLRRVRAGLPTEFQPIDLGRVDVRLHIPLGLGPEALAERIARAILAQLPGGGDE